jgi:hypothetical protein
MPKAAGPNVNGIWSLAPAAGEDVSPQGIQNGIRLDAWNAKRETDAFARLDADIEQQRLAGEKAAEAYAIGFAEFSKPAMVETQRDLFATLADTASSSLGGMVDSAMNSATMLVDIVGTITGAFGAMATNMILSGDAGSKAIKKSVANALAGYSAQAFGLAALLTIAGAAAAATGPIFGWYAPQIFTAAGIAAAGGVALGLSARALGADKVGASPSGSRGGGGGGSGGGMASAAGTNPYRSESSAPQPIHIHIGSETVTRVVDGERRREARRDGISARAEAAA